VCVSRGSEAMTPRIYHIAAGILRQGDALLLVQQQGEYDSAAFWALPGGVMEAGESISDALLREVHEETGLHIAAIEQLAYVMQLDDQSTARQFFAYVFDIHQWSGTLEIADPDGEIRDAAFVPLPEALTKLQTIPWRSMREPLLAYLRGEVSAGCVWLYRQHTADSMELLMTIG